MEATTDVMFVAADMQLFGVDASGVLTKKESDVIMAPSCIQLVSRASLKNSTNLIFKTVSLESRKRTFICGLAFFTILVM